MEDSSLVSIIMPAFNSERFIAESIKSVILQTFSSWQLLIIDDGSTDETWNIILDFSNKDSRIKPFKLPVNQGAGFARNVGIKAAQGSYISFLDTDDLWKPHKLQTQINYMQQNNVKLSYSSYELIDEQGKSLKILITALEKLNFQKILKANYVGNLTGIYDAQSLGKFYCPPIRKRQDWAMWINIIRKAGTARGILEPLAQYRIRKNSISQNKWAMLQYNYNVYRQVLGYSSPKSAAFFLRFLFEQFFIKSRQTKRIDKNQN